MQTSTFVPNYRTQSHRPAALSATALALLMSISAAVATPAAQAGKCPNVQIVLERSTSMGTTLDLFTRITALQTALALNLSTSDTTMRFGLTAFPKTAAACDFETTVLPGYGNGMTISSIVNGYTTATIGSASTGGAINAAASLSALQDATRPQFIILITDGSPACAGTPDTVAGTVNEIRQAYLATPSIATYVLGISTLSAGDADALNQMAVAGGRPLAGTTKYYAGTNSFALFSTVGNVLAAIAAEVGACSDVPGGDMGSSSDMSSPSDLGSPSDLSGAGDLRTATDLAGPRDMASGRDLSGSPLDLTSNPDQRPPTGPAPIVDWIEPNHITAGVGSAANIVGRSFVAKQPSATAYLDGEYGMMPLGNALVLSSSNIQVFLSSTLRVGTYDVVVKNPDGQIGRQPGALTVLDKPAGCACTIGTHAPASGPWPVAASAALLLLAFGVRRRIRSSRN